MSAKHQSPEYARNARTIRARVRAAHRSGRVVACWRGGKPIMPGTAYDVGHVTGAIGHSLAELAPEHRHETPGCCRGNRSHGGSEGAAKTNSRRNKQPATPASQVKTWAI